jgi:hypothetical protein
MLSQAAPRADLFISAKTSTAIPARHPIVRQALIQTTLDPQVRSLDFIPTAAVEATQVALKAIVIIRDDGRFHLDVVEARLVRDVEAEGLPLIALDRLGLAPLTLTAATFAGNRASLTLRQSGSTGFTPSASPCVSRS